MAFQQATDIVATGIGDVEIRFFVPQVGADTGRISIQVFRSNGTIEVIEDNLVARLQDDATGLTHLANLVSMRSYLKTRIIAEVLP